MTNINNITSLSSVNEDTSTKSVLFFWAPWHEDSVSLDSVFTTISTIAPEVNFFKVEAEETAELSQHFGVTVVPTFVTCVGRVALDKLEGEDAHAAILTQTVRRLMDYDVKLEARDSSNGDDVLSEDLTAQVKKSKEELLDDRLESLIHASEVMLFMKGIPTAPRCGFSRQAVEIFSEAGIEFGSFDILGPDDQDVREGLKKKSDWPTYPQIYVRGELIGGLDILKEMREEGDLSEQIGVTKKESLNDRLKKLLSRSRVMLFMKGLPSSPRCGFSRQIVEILNGEDVPYDAFNILEDEEVRQGLKAYSDWPTYPQLYVSGELVGGLDIVKEIAESGDLGDLLKG